MNNEELVKKAEKLVNPEDLTENRTVSQVAAALITEKGNIYTGVSIDLECGIGTCAEHGAIQLMIREGETRIDKIVAVYNDGEILPPCGRCRELMYQVNEENLNTEVIIGDGKTKELRELIPDVWDQEIHDHKQ